MKKEYKTMKEMRNDAIIAAARRVMDRNGGEALSGMALARETLMESAPGYYVQLEHAERKMRELRQGRLRTCKRSRREMWEEIGEKVEERMARDPVISYNRAVAAVLCEEGASRFFVEPDTVRRVLKRMRRRGRRGGL